MRRNPVPGPDPGNRQSHGVAGPDRRAGAASRRGRKSDVMKPIRPERPTGIVDDFPQRIPVSQCELDVIECYLGDLLDEALGRPE
jgi:hypothetical protein